MQEWHSQRKIWKKKDHEMLIRNRKKIATTKLSHILIDVKRTAQQPTREKCRINIIR